MRCLREQYETHAKLMTNGKLPEQSFWGLSFFIVIKKFRCDCKDVPLTVVTRLDKQNKPSAYVGHTR